MTKPKGSEAAANIKASEALAALDCIMSPRTDEAQKVQAIKIWLNLLAELSADQNADEAGRLAAQDLMNRTLLFGDEIADCLERISARTEQPQLARDIRSILILLRRNLFQLAPRPDGAEGYPIN